MISIAFLASFWLNPSTFEASSIRSAASLREIVDGGLNGFDFGFDAGTVSAAAAVDDELDAPVGLSLAVDLDRAG